MWINWIIYDIFSVFCLSGLWDRITSDMGQILVTSDKGYFHSFVLEILWYKISVRFRLTDRHTTFRNSQSMFWYSDKYKSIRKHKSKFIMLPIFFRKFIEENNKTIVSFYRINQKVRVFYVGNKIKVTVFEEYLWEK